MGDLARYGKSSRPGQELLKSRMLVLVSLSLNIFEPLTYRYTGDPDELSIGQRVVVPLGNRFSSGWIVEKDSIYRGRVKTVTGIVADGYLPDPSFVRFAEAVSSLYFTSAGAILDASLSPKRKSTANLYFELDGKQSKFKSHSPGELQQMAKKGALRFYYKRKNKESAAEIESGETIEKGEPGRNLFLIGTSRLNYYMEHIEKTLERGQSVIITVPDNLTAAYMQEKLAKEGIDADIYNSDVALTDREHIWQSYAGEGRKGVVIGALSAITLPVKNPGLIIVERAGSALYKRSFYSRYNVQQLARLRAEHQRVQLIEGFSTYNLHVYQPSPQVTVEDKREGDRQEIAVNVHMIPGRSQGVPDSFVELVSHYFNENKNILVVVNRKESSDFLFCPKCKQVCKCSSSCDGTLELMEEFHVKCLRCGKEQESLNRCPKCAEMLTRVENISISSINKILRDKVMETGVITLAAADFKADRQILNRVRESRIVVATPVVVNPFFNRMFDAVIYIRPEMHINLDEYDAAERVFSITAELKELLKPGGVLDIFSTFHFHYSLRLVNEEDAFFQREIKYRQWFHLPPFCNVYHIESRAKTLRELAGRMRSIYETHKQPLGIKKIYLTGRKPVRGNYKGIIEAHTLPEAIRASGLLKNRDVAIQLELS
jgi:primosomal protein N' (replication factor Y)